MYICICICIYMYTYILMYTHICIYLCVYIYRYRHRYRYIYILLIYVPASVRANIQRKAVRPARTGSSSSHVAPPLRRAATAGSIRAVAATQNDSPPVESLARSPASPSNLELDQRVKVRVRLGLGIRVNPNPNPRSPTTPTSRCMWCICIFRSISIYQDIEIDIETEI